MLDITFSQILIYPSNIDRALPLHSSVVFIPIVFRSLVFISTVSAFPLSLS